MDNVSVVVPTYNERESLRELVERVSVALGKEGIACELIVVDDNSPDGTGKLAEELAGGNTIKNTIIKVIHREGKLGLSSAVLDGFGIAGSEVVGVMDADLSHPPEAIPALVRPILSNEADLVVGSRYVKGGKIIGWSMVRRLTSIGAVYLARIFTSVKDPVSGFFFMRKDVIKDRNLNPIGYKICLEVMVKGEYMRIREVPYVFVNRKKGKSKLNLKEYLNYMIQLFSLLSYRLGFG